MKLFHIIYNRKLRAVFYERWPNKLLRMWHLFVFATYFRVVYCYIPLQNEEGEIPQDLPYFEDASGNSSLDCSEEARKLNRTRTRKDGATGLNKRIAPDGTVWTNLDMGQSYVGRASYHNIVG